MKKWLCIFARYNGNLHDVSQEILSKSVNIARGATMNQFIKNIKQRHRRVNFDESLILQGLIRESPFFINCLLVFIAGYCSSEREFVEILCNCL